MGRAWFQTRRHPSVGTYPYPGHPWRATGLDLAWGRPLPAYGQDNEYVYTQVLGYSDEEYDALVARGLVGDAQLA